MTNGEIVTNYRDNVFAVYYLHQRIEWKQRHGLPVLTMQEEKEQLMKRLLLFEEITDRIEDRRARIIVISRYALGRSVRDIAALLDLSSKTVIGICRETLKGLAGGPVPTPPYCKIKT